MPVQFHNSSPFSHTELKPLTSSYSKPAKLFGLRNRKTGEVIVNFDHNTKYSILLQIAEITECDLIVVEGTWTFTPNEVPNGD